MNHMFMYVYKFYKSLNICYRQSGYQKAVVLYSQGGNMSLTDLELSTARLESTKKAFPDTFLVITYHIYLFIT